MHDTVSVAVVQGTRDLASELASLLLLEATVRNDVVQHLPAVYVFEKHVPMVVCPNDIAHAADVGVVQQHDNGSLTCCPHLLRMVCALPVGLAVVLIRRLAGYDLDGNL
jgi:hypothetical protein